VSKPKQTTLLQKKNLDPYPHTGGNAGKYLLLLWLGFCLEAWLQCGDVRGGGPSKDWVRAGLLGY
jgi:hypothetical protein